MLQLIYFILFILWPKSLLAVSEGELFVNISKIEVNQVADTIRVKIDLEGYKSKIRCYGCVSVDQLNLKCTKGMLVNISVVLVSESSYYNIPFNVSCGSKDNNNPVTDLKITQIDDTATRLSWRLENRDVTKYIVYFVEENRYYHRIISTNDTTYLFPGSSASMRHQICIATIDSRGTSGRYICKASVVVPPLLPINNLVVKANHDSVLVSWDRTSYTEPIHHGYIVNLTSPSGTCKTTVINMKHFCVMAKYHCTFPSIVRWPSLMTLSIDNLIPMSRYSVSISALNNNQESARKMMIFTTKRSGVERVRNIRVSNRGRSLFVQFDYPMDIEGGVVKFKLRVSLDKLNRCNNLQKPIYEGFINSTSKLVATEHWTICCQYLIEVTPVKMCNEGIETNGIISSFIYDVKTKNPEPLIGVKAHIRSNSLLKFYWLNPLPKDGCANFGFEIEVINKKNISDCKIWVISLGTCTSFVKSANSGISCSQNMEYLTLKEDLVRTHILLNGNFIAGETYSIIVWRYTHNTEAILRGDITYPNVPQCVTDCYNTNYTGIISVANNSGICKYWKDFKQYPEYLSNRANFCSMMNQFGPVPVCIHTIYGLLTNCSVPTCSRVANNTLPCVSKYDVRQSQEKISIRWQSPGSPNKVQGYIILLHNTDNRCERYQIQTRSDSIKLMSMDHVIQSFYLSCKSGSILYDWTHETMFNGLPPNKEYFIYIIPLISHLVYGKLTRITVGTTISEPIFPYEMTVSSELNSIYATWNGAFNGVSDGMENHLVKLKRNGIDEPIMTQSSKSIVEFHNLEMCTDYCLYAETLYKSGSSLINDKVCIRTLPPFPGDVEINDIASGPSTLRDISWKYLGNDDCEKQFVLRYKARYSNQNYIQKTTNSRHITLTDLYFGWIIQVEVRAETRKDMEYKFFDGKYSPIKYFYVGEMYPNLSNVSIKSNSSKNTLHIQWSLYGTSWHGFLDYIIRVEMNGECYQGVTLSTSRYGMENGFVPNDRQTLFDERRRCNRMQTQSFEHDNRIFDVTISNMTQQHSRINIYGLNFNGFYHLYNTTY